ncbi:nuclear transport factor 2 family protein [Kaarinaea lacus]
MSELDLSTPEAAEAAFYSAFAECDVKAMDAVWAGENVICIHPGSSALVGREAVMRSWENMLLYAEPPNIHVEVLSRTASEGLAVHVVEEHITAGYGDAASSSMVLATNVYCYENDRWQLLEHHASVPRFPRTGSETASHNKPTLQ